MFLLCWPKFCQHVAPADVSPASLRATRLESHQRTRRQAGPGVKLADGSFHYADFNFTK